MFMKNPQRNFEWFEISFIKKIETIINENKEDSLNWIRDLFISLLLAMFSLLCQILDTEQSKPILRIIFNVGTILSLSGLLIWFIICIIKYSKKLKKLKQRIIPHSIKNYYSIEESVQLFDNDICNQLVLSKNYIELSYDVLDMPLIEFYLIEASHYYFTSIRMFNVICNSNDLQELFTTDSGVCKKINILRLQNYLRLLSSISIDKNKIKVKYENLNIEEYINSYNPLIEAFSQTLTLINETYPELLKTKNNIDEFIKINK